MNEKEAQRTDVDALFFERADAVIALANQQLDDTERGLVSASTLYAVSRFNAWITAGNCASAAHLQQSRDDALDYFVKQYRAMLAENIDDYIAHFDRYLRSPH